MGSNPTLSARSGPTNPADARRSDMKALLIRHADIPPFGRRFDPESYDLRALTGWGHGLETSIMHATVAPGNGPIRHRHPHAEVFVIHTGSGRFEVDGETFDAEAGDVLIIPAGHGTASSQPGRTRSARRPSTRMRGS